MISVVGQDLKVVLGQQEVSSGDQVAAAIQLLKTIPLAKKLVTADAGLLCRPFAQAVLEGGGDYLGVVKDNQPALKEAIDEWIEPQIFSPGPRAAR